MLPAVFIGMFQRLVDFEHNAYARTRVPTHTQSCSVFPPGCFLRLLLSVPCILPSRPVYCSSTILSSPQLLTDCLAFCFDSSSPSCCVHTSTPPSPPPLSSPPLSSPLSSVYPAPNPPHPLLSFIHENADPQQGRGNVNRRKPLVPTNQNRAAAAATRP